MKNKSFIASVTILLILSFIFANQVLAAGPAAIYLSPKTGSYNVGDTFSLVISVNPDTEKIDTVRAKLAFSPDVLEIKSFSVSPMFSYQTGSNEFDNGAGTFSWGAGTPGGTQAASNFGTVVFYVKKAGDARVSVSSGSMVLSAGEDKFNGQLDSASFSLLSVVSVPSEKKQAPRDDEPKSAPAEDLLPVSNETENKIETRIIPKSQDTASLMDSLPFALTTRVFAAIAILLILAFGGITLYKFLNKQNIK